MAQSASSQILLASLGSLKHLDTNAAAARLQAAYLSTTSTTRLKTYFTAPSGQSTSTIFDGVDRASDIEVLGDASMATVMTKIADPYGFNQGFSQFQALMIPNSALVRLMTSVYAEHINAHIASSSLPPLHELRKDAELVRQYHAMITSGDFDPISGRDDYHYAMNLLFVDQYFTSGPAFQLQRQPLNVESIHVLKQWRSKATLPSDVGQARALVARYAYASTGVFSPDGFASTKVEEYAYFLKMDGDLPGLPRRVTKPAPTKTGKIIQSEVNAGTIFSSPELSEYESVAHRLWTQWNDILNDQTPSTFWQIGIRRAQAKQTTKRYKVSPPGSKFPYFVVEQVNGPELADWYHSKKNTSYALAHAKLNNVKEWREGGIGFPFAKDGVASLSCFTPGTSIKTSRGDIAVDELVEEERICTQLSPTQWGIRSSEMIRTPAPASIFGFNNEPAFFTAGHVFYTTTGLRALRPDIARLENPYLDVAQLAVGHQLLRSHNSTDYELVQIHSVSEETCHHDYVYGVNLHNGLRSYHANGFLIAMNYPEIRVSAIARQLQSLLPGERVTALKYFPELQPVFERFGAATALELLSREARNESLSFGGKVTTQNQFQSRDLNMPYVLKFRKGKNHGPQIELLQGILYVDGKFCERAAFKKETLAWSRQLSNGDWEHAFCTFSQTGDVATGHLAYSSDHNQKFNEHASLSARAFDLVPGTVTTVSSRQTRSNGHVFLNGETVDNTYEDKYNFEAHHRTENSTAFSGQETAEQPAMYQMAYDPAVYGPGHDTSTTATVNCGRLILPRINNRLTWSKLELEAPQVIREALSSLANRDVNIKATMKLGDFYRHTVSYDAAQLEHHRFELRSAGTLVESSDEFIAWKAVTPDYVEKEPPIKNLHFTNLGLPADFEIAELFQDIFVTKSLPSIFGVVSLDGIARSYSTSSEGNQGPAHVIIGTKLNTGQVDPASAAKAAAASAVASSRSIIEAHLAPFASALSLENAAENIVEKTLEDLLKIALDLGAVNSDAQVTMTNVMQWHMKDDERRLFFGATNKPAGLPAELTTQLDGTETANWLRDTYAMAYICQMLTANDSQIRDKYRFSDQEKKNVHYFWNGKGANCLSRSEIYKRLEREVSRFQLRKKYDVLRKVHSAGQGLEYSNEIFNRFTEDPDVVDSLPDTNPVTGTSFLTKLCTIMDALDSGTEVEREVEKGDGTNVLFKDTNSNALAITSLARYKGDAWRSQFWGSSSDDERTQMLEEEWMRLSLRDLIEKLLTNDPLVASPVTEALSKEIAAFGEKIEGWEQMSQKAKIETIEAQVGPRIRRLMTAVSVLMGWVKQGTKWVFEGGKRIIANWRQTARAVGDAADRIAQEQPNGLLGGPLLRGIMVLTGIAVVGLTIWSMNDRWNTAPGADKGRMITAVLSSFKQLADFGVDAVYAVMRYKSGSFNHATELAIFERFSDEMGRRVRSRWSDFLQITDKRAELSKMLRGEASAVRELTSSSVDSLPEGNITAQTRVRTVEEALESLNKMSRIQKAFNIARHILAVIGYILSIALAIFMTWQLISDWKNLDTGTKVFNTIQVVLAGIEALAALFMLGAYGAWGITVLWGATATATAVGTFVTAAAAVFAAFAIVIAILAVLVLIAFLIWQSKQSPPPNALETWMEDNGKPWASRRPAPPDPLVVTIEPNSFGYSSALQKVRVTFTNRSEKPQDIQAVVFSFASGKVASALFVEKLKYTVENTPKAGNCALEMASPPELTLTAVSNQSSVEKELMSTNLTIAQKGDDNAEDWPSFSVPVGGQIAVAAWGVVQDEAGADCSLNWSVYSKEDISEGLFTIKRARKG